MMLYERKWKWNLYCAIGVVTFNPRLEVIKILAVPQSSNCREEAVPVEPLITNEGNKWGKKRT